ELLHGTFSLDAKTQVVGAAVHIPPKGGTFRVAYSIDPPTVPIRMMIVTNEIYSALVAGENPQGRPLNNVRIAGEGSQSLYLSGGEYWVAWVLPNGFNFARVTYRTSGTN